MSARDFLKLFFVIAGMTGIFQIAATVAVLLEGVR
jgi:hypothetical protein